MENRIKELIELLDKKEDYFLILSLQTKLNSLKEKKIDSISITSDQFKKAKYSTKHMLKTWILDTPYNKKLTRILESRECSVSDSKNWFYPTNKLSLFFEKKSCKLAKKYYFNHIYENGKTIKGIRYDLDENNEVCKLCLYRREKIEDLQDAYYKTSINAVDNVIKTNTELIKSKAIISKLNLKIKNYDAS